MWFWEHCNLTRTCRPRRVAPVVRRVLCAYRDRIKHVWSSFVTPTSVSLQNNKLPFLWQYLRTCCTYFILIKEISFPVRLKKHFYYKYLHLISWNCFVNVIETAVLCFWRNIRCLSTTIFLESSSMESISYINLLNLQ